MVKNIYINTLLFVWVFGYYILSAFGYPSALFSILLALLSSAVLICVKFKPKLFPFVFSAFFILGSFLFVLIPDLFISEQGFLVNFKFAIQILLFPALLLPVIYFSHVFSVRHKIDFNLFSALSATFLFVVMLGGVIYPDAFRSGVGGFRLSGAVNPNTIGFYGMILLYWSFLLASRSGWSYTVKIIVALSLLVIMWSFSKTAIFSTVTFFISILLGKIFYSFANGRISKKTLIFFFIFMFVFSVLLCVLPIFIDGFFYEFLIGRFSVDSSTTSSLSARQIVWDYLLNFFYSNPFFGDAGWYNSSHLINEHFSGEGGVATSPHNLYIRLLAETGLFGFFVLLMPVFILLLHSIIRMVKTVRMNKFEYDFRLLILSIVFSVMLREAGEDTYLTNYIGLHTSIIFFLLFLSFYKIRKIRGYTHYHRSK